MKYKCGTDVRLGDEIMVQYGPDHESLARIVAIGPDLAIDEIDQSFYSWFKNDASFDKDTVIIEWVGSNPFTHNDPNYAPVASYMTLRSVCCETFVRRGKTS